MSTFQKIAIALDFSECDHFLLEFAKKYTEPEMLYFVHVIPELSILQKSFSNATQAMEKQKEIHSHILDLINDRIKECYQENIPVHKIEILEGKPYHALAHWIKNHSIDLLMVGKKLKSQHSGITSRKLARHLDIPVVFIPDHPVHQIEKILIPMDFSDFSTLALKHAMPWKQKYPEAQIDLLHIVSVLTADHYYGLSLNPGYNQTIIKEAEKEVLDYLAELEIDPQLLNIKITSADYHQIPYKIHEYIMNENPDLVIMGAKGHSLIENLLVGSVTEGFLDYREIIPILLIR